MLEVRGEKDYWFVDTQKKSFSHTAPLTEYFLNETYKAHLNRDNPLGMKGELAEEYADLVKELWSGEHSAVAPRQFKWKLERFAPQFAGYQQHDSQVAHYGKTSLTLRTGTSCIPP